MGTTELPTSDPINAGTTPPALATGDTQRRAAGGDDSPATPARTHVATAPASESPDAFFGTVVDRDGDPIAGASLKLFPKIGNWQKQTPLGAARSDAEGRFSITDARPTEDTIVILARAQGFGGMSMDPIVPGQEISVTLPWIAELSGHVRDAETHAALPSAVVHWGGRDYRCDAEGRYKIPHAQVGNQMWLRVTADGYAEKTTPVSLSTPEPKQLDIALGQGVFLTIQVFDEATKARIPGAEIRRGTRKQPWASADAEGTCTLQIAPGTEIYAYVVAAGYCRVQWTWTK